MSNMPARRPFGRPVSGARVHDDRDPRSCCGDGRQPRNNRDRRSDFRKEPCGAFAKQSHDNWNFKDARRNEADQTEIQSKAKELEHQSDEALEKSDHHEHRHHALTVAVTLLHVSIAIATIAIIMRGQRWPWYGSMALGTAGVIGAAIAYLS
jgi:hypothetical protein